MPAKAEFSKGFWIAAGVIGALVVIGFIYSMVSK